ncbi:MAG: cation:proton antiporter [archaeon]
MVKILSDRHEIGTIHGKLLIGFLLVQDLLVIIALPFLKNTGAVFSADLIAPVLVQSGFLLALAFVFNRFVYPKLFRFGSHSEELLFLASVSSCFVFILLAFLLDFSIGLAAFIAGLALSNLPYNVEVFHKIKGLRDFFSTVFFVTLGMQINFSFTSIPVLALLFLVGVVFVFKPLVFFLMTLFAGYGARIALTVALALSQVSEFSFIIAQQGRQFLDTTPGLYSAIILIISVSMAATPYFMKNSGRAFCFLKKHLEKHVGTKYNGVFTKKIVRLSGEFPALAGHLVIVGAGTIGFGVAKALCGGQELVVIDHDLEAIRRCRQNGIRSIYGSADNFDALKNANISKARALVLSLPDTESAVLLAKFAKKENPKITIFGRSHYYTEALKLYGAGVDFVVMTHVIGGNVFLQNVSEFLQTGKTKNLESLSDEYLGFLAEKAAEEKQKHAENEYRNF